MSPALSRRLAVTGGLALALALVAPTAATADGSGGARGSGDGARTQDGKQGKDGKDGKEARDGRSDGGASGGERSARGGGDPAGNNGTVKVDGVPFDDGKGNEPHVGCTFRLVFWGFDAGDRASITFTGQAPTGGGLLHRETGTLISDDAAGGGQDRDAALVYSVDDELRELLSVTPHPQQGWHVKVAVDVEGAPGGAKQKVLWIDCPQQAAPGSAAPAAAPATPSTGGGTTTTAVPAVPATAPAPVAPAVPSTPPGGTAVSGGTGGAGTADLPPTFGETSVVLDRPAQAAAGTVSARSAARPSALPFTGVAGIGAALAIGLGALLVGGLLARAGHRRGLAADA